MMERTFDELMDGLMLGDGHIEKQVKERNTRFVLRMSVKSREFIDMVSKEFEKNGFRTSINEYLIQKKGDWKERRIISLKTNSNTYFTDLRKRWYPEGKKIVPQDIILTSKTIAIWFWCDGCSIWKKNSNQKVEIILATNAFSKIDLYVLQEQLSRFGFNTWIAKGNVLWLSRSAEVEQFMNLIEPFVLVCFSYKIKHPLVMSISQSQSIAQRNRMRDIKGRFV